jgi:hypothetical protein
MRYTTRTIKYEPYEQSFALCYKGEDDFDDEYYCDICEKPRDPKYWFYYCADINFPAHPKCILGEYPFIKFGRTYKFDTHEHRLALVDKSKGVHPPPCNKCGHSCDFWNFECVKCNFNLHSWCMIGVLDFVARTNCNSLVGVQKITRKMV